MVTVLNLKPGDEVFGWLRSGYALKKARRADGFVCRYVPSRPVRFENSDLSKFVGLITHNDTQNHVLTISVQEKAFLGQPVGEILDAYVPYAALKAMRRRSKISYPGKPEYPARPTRQGIGTQYYSYRTSEEVQLYGY